MLQKQDFSLAELRQLATIRKQCGRIYNYGQMNMLPHFVLQEERLNDVADFIYQLIQQDYPTMEIPFHSRWRHFEAGQIARQLNLESGWQNVEPLEKIRRHIDLVVVSVLLDAGAGSQWSFTENESGQTHGRSEGLGIASLKMFASGKFSSDPRQPFQVDAQALARLTLEDLSSGFQVSPSNPLLGLDGRLSLLRRLASALVNKSEIFGCDGNCRPGLMVDWLLKDKSSSIKEIPLSRLWSAVIDGFEDVWPTEGRLICEGRNLGDAWRHSLLGDSSDSSSIVPFHKLSQWLTYSLLEPLASGGYVVSGLSQMTGLPEYRNGGLFVDFGVLQLRDPDLAKVPQPVDSELIVEWRALTVMLLDKTADLVRRRLNFSEAEFPLAKVLEAGTWKAGRRIAAQKRAGGVPPIQVLSDGTVF
jgi:hypothetical protein